MREIRDILKELTLEEKAALLSGRDFWHLKGIERLGIPSLCITDGPHGLRKTTGGAHAAVSEHVPATCFPAACATACSFDPALLEEMGRAMARECRREGVTVLLGPGANIKRNPLCGRNFEYFSEDPCLTGKLAAGMIRGIEGGNVGTSLKHFAANNQEFCRMVGSSVVDERTLREIYLAGFETAVEEGRPATVMASYNRINGVFACEDSRLLRDILRKEWGFDGLVVTDWGAMNRRVEALRAGTDLEMPGDAPEHTAEILAAVAEGKLTEAEVDQAAERVLRLIQRGMENVPQDYDRAAHHALAGRVAAESAVLLENRRETLPLRPGQKVALIGRFARHPRCQGAGSSKIAHQFLTTPEEAFQAAQVDFRYAEGYGEREIQGDPARLREAAETAEWADVAVVFAGLPDAAESEGYDRRDLRLPPSHVQLVEAVAATGTPTVVVLLCGGVVEVPFADQVDAILLMYLAGQNIGTAACDLLYGRANPSGRLAETWGISLADYASTPWFGQRNPQYRESVYVGYRWFDTAQLPVRWPFGHGLSYTSFAYSNLRITGQGTEWTVRCDVENTGPRFGKEVVQLYVAPPEGTLFRPVRELKGFCKAALAPGEKQTVTLTLHRRAFACYDADAACWRLDGGTYRIEIGASSRDIRLTGEIQVPGEGQLPDLREKAPCYYHPTAPLRVDDAAFAALLGHEIPPEPPTRPFHPNSALVDLRQCLLGRAAFALFEWKPEIFGRFVGYSGQDLSAASDLRRQVEGMSYYMPLRAIPGMSLGKITHRQIDALVELCNGHPLRGVRVLLGGGRTRRRKRPIR